MSETKIIASIDGRPVRVPADAFLKADTFGRSEAEAVSALLRSLVIKYADGKGISLSAEEVQAAHKEASASLSEEIYSGMSKRMALVTTGLNANARDHAEGEAYYQNELAPTMGREEWESLKRINPTNVEVDRVIAEFPRSREELVAESVKSRLEYMRPQKAMKEIVPAVDKTTPQVVALLKSASFLSRFENDKSVSYQLAGPQKREEEAIQAVKNALIVTWVRDQIARYKVEILDPAVADGIEKYANAPYILPNP